MDRGVQIGFAIGLAVSVVAVLAIIRRDHPRVITLMNTTSAAQELRYRVWRVGSKGVEPLPFDENILGRTMPVPSPNGRWIAFVNPVEDYDIHLLDVCTLHERRITRFGQAPRRGYTWVEAEAEGWSPHSGRLLLKVAPGGTESEGGDLAVPEAPYGIYVYDPATSTTKPLTLPKEFEFIAWLRDGRFVGVLPGRLPRDDKLVILRPGEAREPVSEGYSVPARR